MRIRLLILTFLLLVAIPVHSIYFRQLGMEDGLSHFSVISIYQDIHGRMWFGTHEGLSVYDGRQMQVYKPSSLSDKDTCNGYLAGNRVSVITGDREGNIFFMADAALMRYDIKRQRFDVVKKKGIKALTSYEGNIWCILNDSILTYNAESGKLDFRLKTNLRNITRLFVKNDQECWIGTRNGLYATTADGQIRCLLPDLWIHSIYQSSKHEMWVSTWTEGLFRAASGEALHKVAYAPGTSLGIASKQVRNIIEDHVGNIWFGTFDGLQKYNTFTGEYSLYQNDYLPGSLSHSSVYALYTDNRGTVWVGTYFGGINYFSPENDMFRFYPYGQGNTGSLSFPVVGNMVEDRDGNLWICTEGGGLNCLDRKTGTIRSYKASSHPTTLPHNNLKSICYDNQRHCLYIGTHTGGLTRFDIAKQTFRNYQQQESKEDMPGDVIHEVMYYNGKVIVAARNGTFIMDTETETFSLLGDGRSCSSFDIDSDGYAWLSYGQQIICICLKDPSDRKVFTPGHYGTLATRLFVSREGDVYFGSYGSGLFRLDRKDGTIINYTAEKDKLLSNYCYKIAETNLGQLLVTTDKGIMLFSPSDGTLNVVRLGMGIPLVSIVLDCGIYVCRDNEIFVGGTNGLVSFWEEDINNYTPDYNLYFEELYVENKPVYPGDETGILTSALPFTDHITLRYTQNNLSFKFTASDYINILKNNSFEYKLEGFDKEWIKTENSQIYYTNLNPGNYILKVREMQLCNEDIPKEISLALTIRSPWYNTVGAWFVYVLAGSLMVYLIWQAKKARLELALSLREERNEKRRIEELNQAKLRFFTNISHEFRTPLTLMMSHLDILLQNNSFPPTAYSKLKKIYKHTARMRSLITELLDFRKFEQQQMTLNVSEHDMVSFLKDISLSFTDYAAQHNITYNFRCGQEKLMAWFDARQMQKVFFNLLSNAFKYTPDGRQIELMAGEDNDSVFVKVIDTGIGLSETDRTKIFDRFYQAENGKSLSANPGTGIGLALTKSIVTFHQGTIVVESQPDYGSIFTVSLKKGKQHFISAEHIVITEKQEEQALKTDTLPEPTWNEQLAEEFSEQNVQPLSEEQAPVLRYTILLVEDNEELMQVLISLFSPFYHVLSAFNGEEGLQKAADGQPDLIVSDVMMPVMSGTEMCLRIKKDINLCHIPVILLSALNSDEQNVEGLQCGADDYVGKPFNAKILLLRCNNRIRNRIDQQNRLAARQDDYDVSLLATNSLDKEFLDRIILCIDEHLEEENFDVNRLAGEMAMSRSSFFSKFKSLTGMTPASFVLDFKMRKALEMLTGQPHLQIGEISDKLGFGTPHYFSKCFKAKYGQTPAEYRKTRKIDN